tara:strand:+ start:139 stop:1668 length:1530 start_codon:yes stop_codon:yes gene_type:complete
MLCDLIAERNVLAGIFSYGEDGYLEVADIITEKTFTDASNQALFKSFKHLIEDKGITDLDEASVISSCHELGFSWIFEKKTEREHAKAILNTTINLNNIRTWAAKSRKLEIANLLKNQLDAASKDVSSITGEEPIEHILGIAEKRIFDFTSLLQQDSQDDPQQISSGIDEYLDDLEENPRDFVGITSGFPLYDFAIGGGFRRKTVNMIGARTGVGKSMLADNIGIHVAEIGIPVLYLDTEMPTEDHWNRILAKKSRVSINNIETGKYSKNKFHREKVRESADSLKEIPYHSLNVSGRPFEETLSIMRRWLHKSVGFDENGNIKDCLIIYDYLKMLSGDGISASMKEYQILGFMMTSLHNFAVRYDLPVLTFIQLNRDGIDRESTDTVSGSDRIVWLTSNLSIFKPKSDEEIAQDGGDEFGNKKMVPLKCRHGSGLASGDYINMVLEGQYATVTEKDTKHNLISQTQPNETGKPSFVVDGSDQVLFDENIEESAKDLNPEDINKMIVENE